MYVTTVLATAYGAIDDWWTSYGQLDPIS